MKTENADILIKLTNQLEQGYISGMEMPYLKDEFLEWFKNHGPISLSRISLIGNIVVVRLSKAPNTDLIATREDDAFGNFFGLDIYGPYLALQYAFINEDYDLIDQIFTGMKDLLSNRLEETDSNSSDYIHLYNWRTMWGIYEKFINHRVNAIRTNNLEADTKSKSKSYWDNEKRISDILMNRFAFDEYEYPIDLCDAIFKAAEYISYKLSKEFIDKFNYAIDLACNGGCMEIADLYFKQLGDMLPNDEEWKKVNAWDKIISPFLRDVLSEFHKIIEDRAQSVKKEKFTVFCTGKLSNDVNNQDLFQTRKGSSFRDLIYLGGDFDRKDLDVVVSNSATKVWKGEEADNYIKGNTLDYAIESALRLADSSDISNEPYTIYVVVKVPDMDQNINDIYEKVRAHFANDSFVQIAFFSDEYADSISISVIRCKFDDYFTRKWD